jgi:hypothetical protein
MNEETSPRRSGKLRNEFVVLSRVCFGVCLERPLAPARSAVRDRIGNRDGMASLHLLARKNRLLQVQTRTRSPFD